MTKQIPRALRAAALVALALPAAAALSRMAGGAALAKLGWPVAACAAAGGAAALGAQLRGRGIRASAASIAAALALSALATPIYRSALPARTLVAITATGEKNEASIGSEVWVTSVAPDGKELGLPQLLADGWELKSLGELFSARGSIAFELERYKNLRIRFVAHPWSGIVEVATPAGAERYDLYRPSENEGWLDLDIPFAAPEGAQAPWLVDFAFMLGAAACLCVACLLFGRRRGFHAFFGLCAGACLASSNYVNWDLYSRLLLALLAGYAGYKALPLFIGGEWRKYAPTKPKLAALSGIVLYATFACTYNQIVMETIPWSAGWDTAAFVAMWLLFWAMAALAFLAGFENLQRRFVREPEPAELARGKLVLLWLRVFGIIMLGYSFWLIACYPAVMSSDSLDQWGQIHTGAFSNWHPAVHTFLEKLACSVADSPFSPVLAQTVIQCALWATAAVFLRRKKVSIKLLYIMAVVVGFNPSNGIMTVTLWKDVAYAIAMLALAISLGNILTTGLSGLKQSALFVLALFLAATLRHDGIIPALAIAILLSLSVLKKAYRALPFISIALVIFLRIIIYPLANVAPEDGSVTAGTVANAIGSVFHYGGSMDNETRKYLTDIYPEYLWKDYYSPYGNLNGYFFRYTEEQPTVLLEALQEKSIAASDLIPSYVKLFIKNPLVLIRHHLNYTDPFWGLHGSADPQMYRMQYRAYTGWETGFKFQAEGYPDTADSVMGISQSVWISDVFNGASGVYIILSLILAYYLWWGRNIRYAIQFAPNFAHLATLLLVSSGNDIRYMYATNFTFPFLLLFALLATQKHLRETGREAK
jgi:hypothetical protein